MVHDEQYIEVTPMPLGLLEFPLYIIHGSLHAHGFPQSRMTSCHQDPD